MARCVSLLTVIAAMAMCPAAVALDDSAVTMAQLPGRDGCLSSDPKDGDDCAPVRNGLGMAAISPDGRNLYAVGNGITVFARDRLTGALTVVGCMSASATEDCAVEPLIDGAWSVAVSPDRSNVYVSGHAMPEGAPEYGYPTMVVFARDRDSGDLERTQCLSTADVPDCEIVPNVGRAIVSPDGRHVYLASGVRAGATTLFDRDPGSGALRNPRCAYAVDAAEECPARPIRVLSTDGRFAYHWHETINVYSRDPATGILSEVVCPPESYTCPRPREGYFSDVAVTPDGRNVLATEWFPERGWLFNIDADPSSGVLKTRNCFSTGGEPAGCTEVPALDNPVDVEVAPDGHSVYVPSGSNWANIGGFSSFARDPETGDLSLAGCVTEDGAGGACVLGKAIGGARRLLVSPDSRNVYVMAPRSIGVMGLAVNITPEDLPVSDYGEVLPELTCPIGPAECEGAVSLRTVKRFRVRRDGRVVKRRLRVGSRRFELAPGASRRVRVRLARPAKTVVRRFSRVRTRATVSAREVPGRTVREMKLRRASVPSGR